MAQHAHQNAEREKREQKMKERLSTILENEKKRKEAVGKMYKHLMRNGVRDPRVEVVVSFVSCYFVLIIVFFLFCFFFFCFFVFCFVCVFFWFFFITFFVFSGCRGCRDDVQAPCARCRAQSLR